MKQFKPNEKVVFSTKKIRDYIIGKFAILPKESEIVTVKGKDSLTGNYVLNEYPISTRGNVQLFSEICLFPVDEILKQETEKITSDMEAFFKSKEKATSIFKRLFN